MFCNKCGVELSEGSAFCNKCGSPQGGVLPATGAAALKAPADAPPAKEEEVWRGGYSPRAMGMGFVGAGAWFVGLWIAYFLLTGKGSWFEGKGWVIYLFGTLSPIPFIYVGWLALWRRLTLHYRLTTQRLFAERGFIGRHIDELELIRVDDVATNQNIFERIFDVGTVTVKSSDITTPSLTLHGIRGPIQVKEKLRAQVQERRKRIVNLNQV